MTVPRTTPSSPARDPLRRVPPVPAVPVRNTDAVATAPVPARADGDRDDAADGALMTPQEELDFQWVINRMRSLNDLLPPAPQTKRVLGPAIDDYVGDRAVPSTSFALPRSRMMESLAADANARLSQDKDSLKEQKKSKAILSAPLARHRRYYREEGRAGASPTLNSSMSDLLKLPLDQAAKKDVVLSVAETKEFEAGIDSSCSAVSWLDHWLNAFGRSALDPTRDEVSIRRMLQSGSKALFFLARQLNTMWANLKLKRRDAVLGSLALGCTPENVAALRFGSLDDPDRLFPEEAIRDVTQDRRTRAESKSLQKIAFSSEKKRSSPSRGHSSGSGRAPKAQKTSGQASDPSPTDKDSEQPFQKPSGSHRGKKKGKGKKRGGAS